MGLISWEKIGTSMQIKVLQQRERIVLASVAANIEYNYYF